MKTNHLVDENHEGSSDRRFNDALEHPFLISLSYHQQEDDDHPSSHQHKTQETHQVLINFTVFSQLSL